MCALSVFLLRNGNSHSGQHPTWKARVLNLARTILGLAVAFGLLGSGYYGFSATSDSQLFRVNVPGRISIVAPTVSPLRTHVAGNANLGFPRQNWVARSNAVAGATVILQTATCFQHTTSSAAKRDGRLALRVLSSSGPGLWTVTRATDRTRYGTGDEDAHVQAVCSEIGEAQLGLTVTFLTGVGADLEAGDYSMTVVGTITAN